MLRPYQSALIPRVRQAVVALRVAKKQPRVVVVSPCGSGKTTLHAHIAAAHVERGGSVLWMAPRTELIDQAGTALLAVGLRIGVICPSSIHSPQPYAPVQVATPQTLHGREHRPKATLIITDEAHLFVAKTLRGILDDYPDAIVLGPTATPERGDGRGLGEVFEDIVIGSTVRELVAGGWLVPIPDDKLIRPGRKLRSGEIAQRPVDAYLRHARGRRAMVFSPGVKRAEEHAAEFRALGVPATCVHDATPWGERRAAFKALARGEILALTNVAIGTYGLDIPAVDCVILARTFGHQGGYLQAVGRGERTSPETGKSDLIVIDLNGVSHDFGHPEDDRVYSLGEKGIAKQGETDPVVVQAYCKVCKRPMDPDETVCPDCGTVREPPALRVTGDVLVPYQVALARDAPDVRARRLARWMQEEKVDGTPKKESAAMHKYAACYQVRWPPSDVIAAARRLVREAMEQNAAVQQEAQGGWQ